MRRTRFQSQLTTKKPMLITSVITRFAPLPMSESHQKPDACHASPNLGARTFAPGSRSQVSKPMSKHAREVIHPQTHDESHAVQNIVMLFEVLNQRPLLLDIKADWSV